MRLGVGSSKTGLRASGDRWLVGLAGLARDCWDWPSRAEVRPGVSGGQTTSASDRAVAAGLGVASAALRSARLRARRERRRGSGPEARAPSPEGTALVTPVFPATPLARVAPAGEAGLG